MFPSLPVYTLYTGRSHDQWSPSLIFDTFANVLLYLSSCLLGLSFSKVCLRFIQLLAQTKQDLDHPGQLVTSNL